MILVWPPGSKCRETWGKRKFWLSSACLNGHFRPFLQPLGFPKKGHRGLAACNAATKSSGIESPLEERCVLEGCAVEGRALEGCALGFSASSSSASAFAASAVEPGGGMYSPSESVSVSKAAIDVPVLDAATLGLLARALLDEAAV